MPWPSWLFWSQSQDRDDNKNENPAVEPQRPSHVHDVKPTQSWDDTLNRTDWSHYTTPQTITISIMTAFATLALNRLYKTYLRRIPTADYLKPGFFRRRSLYGFVSYVGDGDNFRFFHTPGGKLMGWSWLGRRRLRRWNLRDFKDKTLSIRIAGVDAPETAHFGRPAQPYSQEALDWLRSMVLQRSVRVWPYRQDQYGRIVSSVYIRRWIFFKSDVGLEMLKRGLATVYEAKFGSEFGNREQQYHEAEEHAKARKVGMWEEPGLVSKLLGRKKAPLETPRQYKTRVATQEKEGKIADMAK